MSTAAQNTGRPAEEIPPLVLFDQCGRIVVGDRSTSTESTAVVTTSGTDELLSAIAAAAINPQVDAAKMRALWELKNSIDDRAAEQAFNRAMVLAQSEMRPIVRDAENKDNHSKYARLETIDRLIRPVYTKHGFAFTFSSPSTDKATITVSCKLLHRDGHAEPYSLSGEIDNAGPKGGKTKTDIQGLGSTVSYLRRYLTLMAFNLSLVNPGEDLDGCDPELVNHAQLNQLQDLLLACEMNADSPDLKRFYAYMDVKDVSQIRAHDFMKALTALQAKYKHLQGA